MKKPGIPKPYNEVAAKAIDHLSTNRDTEKHDGHERAASETSVMATLNLLQGKNNVGISMSKDRGISWCAKTSWRKSCFVLEKQQFG